MVISIKEILERNLIEGREIGDGEGLVEPEGVAIDIRLGEIWEMIPESEAFLKLGTRKTREYKKVAEYTPNKSTIFTLQPGKIYQFKALERINIPNDLVARFIARYNLLANGIIILAYKADPGFSGHMNVVAINQSGADFNIELGARWGQFEFHRIDGEGVEYRGQWGDRLHTDGEETQV